MIVDVPLFTPVYKNIDKSLNNDDNYLVMDGYLDSKGGTNPRPGLLGAGILSGASLSPIDGLFWWDKKEIIVAISSGNVWVLNSSFSGSNLSGGGTVASAGVRPTFATDGTTLFIATGGRIIQTDGSTTPGTIYIADADAPTAVTHIGMVDGYLIAVASGSGKFYFSELDSPTVWSALDFATAGSDPDNTIAFHVFRKELYFFGRESLEIWQNDGQTPFSRVEGGFLEIGCLAPYSIIRTDNHIMWLSDKKRFVRYAGGGVETFSTPYDKELDTFTTYSDCTADRINIVGRSFYVFQFPTQGRTLVYNETDDNWTEWGKWNSVSGSYERWLGASYVYSPIWNKHIVGSREATGRFYYMSPDYTDDYGDAIRTARTTGHISYGSNNQKRSNRLTFRVKRGATTGSGEPKLMFRVKNDDKTWSNERQISLGRKGETRNIVKLDRLGVFRTRQYEFAVSDAVGWAFSEAKEDIYVGDF